MMLLISINMLSENITYSKTNRVAEIACLEFIVNDDNNPNDNNNEIDSNPNQNKQGKSTIETDNKNEFLNINTTHNEINDYSKSNSEDNNNIDDNSNDSYTNTNTNITNTNNSDSSNSFRILVGNTHLLYPASPKFDEILRDLQIRELINSIQFYKQDFDEKIDTNLNLGLNSDNGSNKINKQISCSLLIGDLNCTIKGNCAQKPQDDGFISSYHYYKIQENSNENIENIDIQSESNKIEFISHRSHEGKQSGCDFIFYKSFVLFCFIFPFHFLSSKFGMLLLFLICF